MNKFLGQIFSILGILIVLNLLTYFWIGDAENSRFYDYYRIIERLQKKHYKILITGDSHANSAWRYEDSEDVLNFSFAGDNVIDISKKLTFLKKNGYSFDIHLMESDPHQLTTYRSSTNNNDLSNYFDSKLRWVNARKYFPLFFNARVKDDIMNQFREANTDNQEKQEEIKEASMLKRAKTQFLEPKYSEEMAQIFEENIKHSLKEEMKVVFLNYPIYKSYKAIIDTGSTYINARNKVDRLKENYELESINLEDLFCSKDKFSNQDHVNRKGSKLFRDKVQSCLQTSECESVDCMESRNIE